MPWNVKYRIDGHPEEFSSGPYDTMEIANSHADDIRGYEGVQYAIVIHEAIIEINPDDSDCG
jgi:hypothetical protein